MIETVGVCKFNPYLIVNTPRFHYKYKPTLLFEIIVFIVREVLNMCTVV